MLEERVDSSSDAHQQFVWGRRYIDDCVLRDRDTTGNGTLDERLYALQDANWNVTAIVDAAGTVQERFAYSAYGTPLFLNASFAEQASSSHSWERLYGGYQFDANVEWYAVRHRVFVPQLDWVQRDPLSDGTNLYQYGDATPVNALDPSGLLAGNPYVSPPPLSPPPPPGAGLAAIRLFLGGVFIGCWGGAIAGGASALIYAQIDDWLAGRLPDAGSPLCVALGSCGLGIGAASISMLIAGVINPVGAGAGTVLGALVYTLTCCACGGGCDKGWFCAPGRLLCDFFN